jgi:hypothetical protein
MNDKLFKELGIQSSPATLSKLLGKVVQNFIGIFRQAFAEGEVTLGVIKVKNRDLLKTSLIVAQIDDKRAFRQYHPNEDPNAVVESVKDARIKIREAASGVWADSSQELLIKQLQEVIADFLTIMERNSPIPNIPSDSKWQQFSEELELLRLKVWSIIAALKVIHGDILVVKHLPEKIRDAVEQHMKS